VCEDERREVLILASGSPRRAELLASAELTFTVIPSDASEAHLSGEGAVPYVRRVAAEKARRVADRCWAEGDRRPVLAADTVVVVDGAILGKPADRTEARRMLESLSGREHEVITGYRVLIPGGGEQREEVTTQVRFKRLHPDEIQAYLDTGEWRDKAGAYAVQGHAAALVEAVFGSYTNIVGLPLCQVVEALRRAGCLPPRHGAQGAPR
jgi:septum formation protein